MICIKGGKVCDNKDDDNDDDLKLQNQEITFILSHLVCHHLIVCSVPQFIP